MRNINIALKVLALKSGIEFCATVQKEQSRIRQFDSSLGLVSSAIFFK